MVFNIFRVRRQYGINNIVIDKKTIIVPTVVLCKSVLNIYRVYSDRIMDEKKKNPYFYNERLSGTFVEGGRIERRRSCRITYRVPNNTITSCYYCSTSSCCVIMCAAGRARKNKMSFPQTNIPPRRGRTCTAQDTRFTRLKKLFVVAVVPVRPHGAFS